MCGMVFLMTVTDPRIKKLLTHYKKISLLERTKAILAWDLNVYMPEKAAKDRSEQTAFLANCITDLWLDHDFSQGL